ncbi:MAG: DNRLRE domain-containing protein, partial [Planctomycetes bacterium]|nr:DNRLRE domain-containing protein [Planctomycetota bacterium]
MRVLQQREKEIPMSSGHRSWVAFWCVAGLVAWGHDADGGAVVLAPAADTYIEPYGAEAKNHGANPQLRIDQYGLRQALLRFPLNDLPAGKRIVSAKLRLFVTDIGFNEAGEMPDFKTCVGLFDLVTPWTEAGATFSTCDGQKPWSQGPGIPGGKYGDVGPLPKPDIGVHLRQPLIPLDPQKVTKNSWMELDVSDFLRRRVRAGDKEVNLLLRAGLSGLARNYTFRSREAKEQEQRPQLAVDVSDTVADFTLGEVFLTDWKPGRSVSVTLKGAGQARWAFVRKPGASRLEDGALKATADGASFTPDAPGLYRIKCEISVGNQATTEMADAYVLSVRPHPRLYVTAERLSALRKQAAEGARLFTAFKARVDSGNAGLPQGKYHDFGLPEGCEDNALAYLLTRNTQYAANSIAYAQLILQKPMREHFKDVHGATFIGANWAHAMAVHYDWCYDQLKPEHRRAVAEWLKEAAAWSWARSGRPIAHNDGGGRQIILASAPMALLGDDPEAPSFLRRSHENFENNLLPWLNDAGRGGRSGDGGSYEGLHAFFIVRHAWLSHTATGEDVFSDSPFFRNRVKHILFGWYPRRLVAKDGSFSIRTYYSPSGDHIRWGYVGDVYPWQSAAALCDRYRDTPEGQGLRWLAGEWSVEWPKYATKWAVLGDFDSVPKKEPKELTYRDEGFHTVYVRSDWTDDATWVLFEHGPQVSAHQSLDKGGFEIFKGDILAARTGNLDHGNVGAQHAAAYLHRTISGNCLLINDPEEKWRGFLAGATGENDGGGQRTNYPLTSGPDAATYLTYRPVFQRGHIARFADTKDFTYALADITNAYNCPSFHGGKWNKPKVTSVTRQLLYVRGLDSVAVFDRVSSTNPEFK